MSYARNPELQRLLAALNGAARNEDNTPKSQGNDTDVQQEYNPATPDASFSLPPQTTTRPRPSEPTTDPRRKIPVKPTPPVTREPEQLGSSTPQTNPASEAENITTWPGALKHVTRHLAHSDQASQHIKHLIMEQRKHERQWYAQREAIITRHAGRKGNQAKAAALLASLGVAASETGPNAVVDDVNAEGDMGKELEAFDAKVYRGLQAMAKDFDGQFRKLGVPFFCIRADLVEGGGNGMGKLGKTELRELRKRMLEMLEDLFGD